MQFRFLCVVLLFVATADGAIFFVRLKEVAGYPDRCFEPEEGLYLTDGDTDNPLGNCVSYSCNIDDEGPYLVFSTCGVSVAGEGCIVTETDITRRYPYCCPQILCKGEPKTR